jgi:hypothetical protein
MTTVVCYYNFLCMTSWHGRRINYNILDKHAKLKKISSKITHVESDFVCSRNNQNYIEWHNSCLKNLFQTGLFRNIILYMPFMIL